MKVYDYGECMFHRAYTNFSYPVGWGHPCIRLLNWPNLDMLSAIEPPTSTYP